LVRSSDLPRLDRHRSQRCDNSATWVRFSQNGSDPSISLLARCIFSETRVGVAEATRLWTPQAVVEPITTEAP
jgi:hypothetical protein